MPQKRHLSRAHRCSNCNFPAHKEITYNNNCSAGMCIIKISILTQLWHDTNGVPAIVFGYNVETAEVSISSEYIAL